MQSSVRVGHAESACRSCFGCTPSDRESGRGRRALLARPVTPPSGRVGYLPAVLATGVSFIASIDGGTIEAGVPLDTDVRYGRRKTDKLVNLL